MTRIIDLVKNQDCEIMSRIYSIRGRKVSLDRETLLIYTVWKQNGLKELPEEKSRIR